MKTFSRLFIVFLICVVSACSSDDNPGKADIPDALPIELRSGFDDKLKQDNNFAFDLLKTTNKYDRKSNLFISPLSVSMALNMTVNGANGSTRDEMLTALRVNGYSVDDVNEYSKSLREALLSVDPTTRISIANSIWYRLGFPVEDAFIQVNKTNYNAEVKAVDFSDGGTVKQINNWVANNTNNKITEVIDNIPGNAMMYLINAVYFKGIWKFEFDKSDTEKRVFNADGGKTQEVQTMKQENEFNYSFDENCAYLEMPYGNGAFSMVLMLPHDDKTTDNVIENLNAETWNSAMSGMNLRKVRLYLPRFKFKGDYSLDSNILPDMGMKLAFEEEADFSNITRNMRLNISKVLHKTFIEVNEEGSEAAAVTVISFETTSPGGGLTKFTVDKPFLFAIKEKSTGVILFIGKVGEIEQ